MPSPSQANASERLATRAIPIEPTVGVDPYFLRMAVKSKRPRWVGRIVVSVVVGMVVGGTYFGMRYYDYPFAAADAESAVVAYRAAGLPWEAKDLASDPAVAPEENAAPLLRKAIAQLPDPRDFDYKELQEDVRDKRFEKVRSVLRTYGRGLTLACQAAEKPRLDFDRDWDEGSSLLFPEYPRMKEAVRLLCLRAEARGGQGDAAAALADLRAAWSLARLSGEEPIPFSLEFRASCELHVLNAVKVCAAQWSDEPSRLEKLGALLAAPRPYLDYMRYMSGEIYLTLAALRNSDLDSALSMSESIPVLKNPLQRTGLPDSMKARAYADRMMRGWVEAKALIDRYRDAPLELEARFANLSDRLNERKSLSNRLNAIFFPYLNSKALLRAQANLATTRAVLATMLERAQRDVTARLR